VTLTDPAAFAVTADACSAASLGPGQTCSITVRFTSAAGAMTATLRAASTDPAATATDALTGEVAPAIYWANAGDHSPGAGAVWTAGLDGSSPHTIVTGVLAPELQGGVAVNADQLYWGDVNQGAISAANLDGSSPHTIITGQNGPEGVAVAGQLYWSNVGFGAAGTGTVGEANLDGSGRHIIVTGQDVPQMMAVTPAGP